LLGFVEGDGSFCVRTRGSTLIFGIGQTISERPVMEAIKRFLLSLPGDYTTRPNSNVVAISTKSPSNNSSKNQKSSIHIEITDTKCIKNKIVPAQQVGPRGTRGGDPNHLFF
jgi:hypothetical protein